MVSNLFGFCCTKRNKDDIGSLSYDARDILANNPGLGEVFSCLKRIEDTFFRQPIKDLDDLIERLQDGAGYEDQRDGTYMTAEGDNAGKKIEINNV
jgi:hypothetical protein